MQSEYGIVPHKHHSRYLGKEFLFLYPLCGPPRVYKSYTQTTKRQTKASFAKIRIIRRLKKTRNELRWLTWYLLRKVRAKSEHCDFEEEGTSPPPRRTIMHDRLSVELHFNASTIPKGPKGHEDRREERLASTCLDISGLLADGNCGLKAG